MKILSYKYYHKNSEWNISNTLPHEKKNKYNFYWLYNKYICTEICVRELHFALMAFDLFFIQSAISINKPLPVFWRKIPREPKKAESVENFSNTQRVMFQSEVTLIIP